jgi:hypothetical protein
MLALMRWELQAEMLASTQYCKKEITGDREIVLIYQCGLVLDMR